MHGFPFSFAFLAFPFLSLHIIFLLTFTAQTGKPICLVEGSNDAFPPKEVSFGVSSKKIEFMGSVTPKISQKGGVLYGFPAKLEESIKTRISVKSKAIDTKFEL
jgi:hypothetical protein